MVYQCIGLRMERDREPAIQGMHVNVNECAALHRKWIRQTKYSDRGPASNCRRVVVPATFTPQIVPTHQRRFTGFDDKILSLYARGMTTREIQGHLEEIYGAEVSPSLISAVTDAVIEELKEWQKPPSGAVVSRSCFWMR